MIFGILSRPRFLPVVSDLGNTPLGRLLRGTGENVSSTQTPSETVPVIVIAPSEVTHGVTAGSRC